MFDFFFLSICFSGSESENLTRYGNALKKYNGLADGITEDEDESSTASPAPKSKTIQETTANLVSITNGSNLDAVVQQNLRDNLYDVSVWYEDNEMKFLAVERLDKKIELDESAAPTTIDQSASDSSTTTTSGGDASAEPTVSSNGSVGSIGPYTLPSGEAAAVAAAAVEAVAANQTQSSSSSGESVKFAIPSLSQPPRTKHTVKGVVALCNFMIDHFGKIKKSFVDDDDDDEHSDEEETPTTTGRKKKGQMDATPKSTKRGAPTKRSLDKSPSDGEDEPKTKQSKSASKKSASKIEQTPTKEDANEQKSEYSVFARWCDKKYYAGRVTEAKPGNRFVVLFEDGASKILQHDYIVFGQEDGVLPLLNHVVHVLIDEETYEPGLVKEAKRDGDKVIYTVETESKTVTVTASDLYLEDDQAKAIQNITKDAVPDLLKTPETPSSKRAGRPSAKLEESQATTSTRGRPKKSATASQPSTPEPGFSGNVGASGRKGRKPNKRYS